MNELGTTEFGGATLQQILPSLGDAVVYYFTMKPKKLYVQLVEDVVRHLFVLRPKRKYVGGLRLQDFSIVR